MKSRPFTLVELIVAISIMAVIGGLLGTISATFYNAWSRTSRVVQRLDAYQSIDRIAENLMRNIVPFEWYDDSDTAYPVFHGEKDQLLFVALQRSYAKKEGGLRFVRLRVEDSTLYADYATIPSMLPWEDENDWNYESEPLAEQVKEISFLYADFDSDDSSQLTWEDTWSYEEHTVMPLAVQLTVEFEDGTTEVWLRRTAGSGAFSTYGLREESLSEEF